MKAWSPEELPKPTESGEQHIRDIETWGYCLVANAIGGDDLAAVRRRIEEQANAEREQGHQPAALVQDPDQVNQWVFMLMNKGEAFQRLLFRPPVTAVVEHLLGPDYLLSDFAAHLTRPGNSLLPLHTDQWWLPPPCLPGATHVRPGTIGRRMDVAEPGPPSVASAPINPPVVVNAMWMVTDYTEANGATRLVPRSHLSGKQPAQGVPHPCDSVPAEGAAGTVVIWDGRIWHSAGANVGDRPRYGVTTFYGGPQFRSLSNWTLGTKQHVLDRASPELLALLGFRPFGGYGDTGLRGGSLALPADRLIGELRPSRIDSGV